MIRGFKVGNAAPLGIALHSQDRGGPAGALFVGAIGAESSKSAKNQGEVAAEKLGAVHLLWHGIRCFKVDGHGGRTDLLLSLPPDDEAVRANTPLALTEWKIATDSNYAAQAHAAKNQMNRYTAEPLGNLEIVHHRFIVLVSDQRLRAIPNTQEANVTVRYINIAVSSESPSRDRSQQ